MLRTIRNVTSYWYRTFDKIDTAKREIKMIGIGNSFSVFWYIQRASRQPLSSSMEQTYVLVMVRDVEYSMIHNNNKNLHNILCTSLIFSISWSTLTSFHISIFYFFRLSEILNSHISRFLFRRIVLGWIFVVLLPLE